MDIGKKSIFSKIGGIPQVPTGFKWPDDKNNREIPFFMQLDFKQINRAGKLTYFPNKGLLYIFIDENEINSNFPLVQGEHYQVLFFDADTNDMHTEKSNVKTYREIYLKTKDIKMYPNSEEDDDLLDYLDELDDDVQDKYFDKYHFVESEVGFVGGWPQILQSNYLERDETQLIQLNSIEDEFMWGDLGMLQFYIKIDDLKKSNFNNVNVNLETT